ncbi:beta-xylosidase-like [Hibiscus syriacus]|uniref:beta-xylosidase-like n=1 Tax=Hibiscus syriacus TaxID=106335 RepID=UPI0019221E0C|nr:beta-xylosidase-like [Hibiscus syriacus]
MDSIYKNPDALVEDRVKDLLSRRTIQEKMGQMTQIERTAATPAALKSFSIDTISLLGIFSCRTTLCGNSGDNEELVVPLNGSDIISLVADKIPTLAMLISGRPLVLEPRVLEKVEALVDAWFPGTEGRGITDLVFGDFKFNSRLPMTWLRSTKQLPMNPRHNSYDPLFPLGFGLTYNMERKHQEYTSSGHAAGLRFMDNQWDKQLFYQYASYLLLYHLYIACKCLCSNTLSL